MKKVIELINNRIAKHQKELAEITDYINEQQTDGEKVVPRFSAALLEAYIEEDNEILKDIAAAPYIGTPPPRDAGKLEEPDTDGRTTAGGALLTAVIVILILALGCVSCAPQYGCPALKSSNTHGFAK